MNHLQCKLTSALLFALALAALFSLGGCESGSGNDGGRSQPQKPIDDGATQELNLKGVVELFPAGAQVVAYAVDGYSNAKTRKTLATTTTDSFGAYTLVLPADVNSTPILLEAQVEPGVTPVICPLLEGCDGVAFGAAHFTEGAVSFRAAITEPRSGIYNLSLLSSVAANMALNSEVQSAQQLHSNIAAASARLAAIFELFGPATSMPILNWADASQLEQSSLDALRASAIGPALAGQCSAATGELDIAESYAEAMRMLAEDGLVVEVDPINKLSERVMNHRMIQMAQYWRNILPMSAFISERHSANAMLTMTTERYAEAGDSFVSNPDVLVDSQQFINDVRQAGGSINQKQLEVFKSLTDLLASSENPITKFGVNLEGVNFFAADQRKQLEGAATQTFMAMAEVLGQHYGRNPVPGVVDGIPVIFTDYGDRQVASVVSNISACAEDLQGCNVGVDFTIEVRAAAVGGGAGLQRLELEEVEVVPFGSFTFEDGAQVVINKEDQPVLQADIVSLRYSSDTIEQGSRERAFLNFRNLLANLPLRVSFPPHSEQSDSFFAMHLALEHGRARTESIEHTEITENGVQKRLQQEYVLSDLQGFAINLAGKGLADEAARFSLSIVADQHRPNATLELRREVIAACSDLRTHDCEDAPATLTPVVHDGSELLTLSVTALARARLIGYPDPVWIKFSGTRNEADSAAINFLTVSRPEGALWLNGEFNDTGATQLTAYNRLGYFFDIHRDGSMRDGGVYSPTGELVVELKDMGSWIKLTYPDGTFDSI